MWTGTNAWWVAVNHLVISLQKTVIWARFKIREVTDLGTYRVSPLLIMEKNNEFQYKLQRLKISLCAMKIVLLYITFPFRWHFQSACQLSLVDNLMRALHWVRLFAQLYTAKILLVSGPINNAEHVNQSFLWYVTFHIIHVKSYYKRFFCETPGSVRIMLAVGTNGILCGWSKDVTVASWQIWWQMTNFWYIRMPVESWQPI